MQRYFLGILALLLTTTGLLWLWNGTNNELENAIAAACLKVGPVLGALWLAFPQVLQLVRRFPPTLIVAIVVSSGFVIVRPKSAPFVVPVLFAILGLHYLGLLFKSTAKKR
ncbi:MAG: hypothetical protein CMJ75_22740 [Planctomycetaceae bacterium]|nr:hypothetical protein [Planctomycetaceae bacterium]